MGSTSFAGRLVLAAILACCGAWPSIAQEADVLDAFDAPFAFENQGFESVRERDRPGYDPAPLLAGSWRLLPEIALDAVYDSNIYAIRDGKDDAIFRLSPRLDASLDTGVIRVRAAARAERDQFLSADGQSSTDFAGGLALATDVSRRAQLYAGARGGRYSEARTDPDRPLGLLGPVQYDLLAGYVGAGQSFNRLRLAVRGTVDDRSFRDALDSTGSDVAQNFRNRRVWTATASADYALSPALALFVEGTGNRRDYRNQQGQEFERDSKGYDVVAGVRFDSGALVRGSLAAGYFNQDFSSAVLPDVNGLTVRALADYAPTPLVTLRFIGKHGIEEASTVGTGSYLATEASVRADYELLRNLILDATIGYERADFRQIDRRQDGVIASVGAEYRFGPRFAVRANASFRDETASGSDPGREYERFRLLAGIVWRGI